MEIWKKNVENMENAQKALKYGIKSFYILKQQVFIFLVSPLNEAPVLFMEI